MVELLVVISILLFIATITIQGFANYSYRQVYTGFVSQTKDSLIETRHKTIASYNDTVYGVYVGTTTIEFFSGATPVVGSADNTVFTIPSGITATSSFSTGNWYTTFSRITGAATATGTIEFEDTRTIASTTLTIYASGLVE